MNDPFNNDQGVTPEALAELKARFSDSEGNEDFEKLLKAKAESNLHIAKIEAENAMMRTEVDKSATIDEIMTELRKNKISEGDPVPNTPVQNQGTEQGNSEQVDINELVSKTLAEQQKASREESNLQTAIQKMNEVWGGDATQTLLQISSQLGVSKEYLADIAKQSPTAFYNMVGLNQVKPSVPGRVPEGASLTELSHGEITRDQKWYQNLRKTDPKRYNSDEIQIQMHKDAVAQGPDFFNA